VALLVFKCSALLAHTLPIAFFNHFPVLHWEILHLALSSLVCVPPAASDAVFCP
jgi:hypothetical protein